MYSSITYGFFKCENIEQVSLSKVRASANRTYSTPAYVSILYCISYNRNCLVFSMQESIAYFPLVVLVTGVLASTAVKPLNKRLGSKVNKKKRVLVISYHY